MSFPPWGLRDNVYYSSQGSLESS